MKKLLFIAAAMLLCASADAKPKKKSKTVLFTVNLHCDACVSKLEKNIPFEKGFTDMDIDLEKDLVEVTFNPEKTDSLSIAKAIEKLDFKVEGATPKTTHEEGCGGCSNH